MTGSKPTVGEIIASLQKFPSEMPLEIAIRQKNKRHPVEYINPDLSEYNQYVTSPDGVHARLTIRLPETETGYIKLANHKTIKK